MKKYLENDEDVEILETWKDLKEYLTFRAKHDEWVQPFINELAAIGIPNHPLFFQTNCTNLSVQKNGYRLDVKDIDYEDPENLSCIEDTGLFLVFPYKDSMAVYPTRRIAYPSICKRGDDDSMVMARFDPKANKQVLPINEKADRLTRDFQLFSDNCKILLRDGKVSAVLSKEYVILPADKMISILENQLKQDHPDFTFNRGQVSHEYLMVEYLMNDEEMEQSFRLKLNDAGADISELKAGIRFSTSDIGASKVYASVFYDADGVRTTCNSGIALEHKGEASPQLYAESCKQLGMVFKESEELIEKLGNMNISDVAGVVQEIRENYSIFPKGISEKVEAELRIQYPGGGTAIDVYLALNDIIQRYSEENKISPTRYLNLSEQVAQLSNLPSPYNLSIFLHVLQLDGKAYLRVDCNNPIFQKAFRSLEDVSVSAVECQDPKNSKNILWQKLCKRYEEMLPLSKNLTTELYPDWEHMTYPDVNSRCEDFARQNIANSYLTHLNAGQQMIPPHLLMPYVEESINYLQSEYGKNEYREKVQFLKKVFIDLNADDSIVRNIQPQFKTEEEPVINENTETDLEK